MTTPSFLLMEVHTDLMLVAACAVGDTMTALAGGFCAKLCVTV